jgi:xylan 1,4-beta-xylosidase
MDFASTHVYGNDSAKDVFGTNEVIPRSDMVARAMRKVYDQVKASKRPDMPIIWSEFNASYANEQKVTDSAYMGPWLANHIRQADGLATETSLWTFSDVFEEGGVAKTPYYGGFGLIATGGIPKLAFNALKLLHLLGDKRIPVDSKSVLATKRADGSVICAVWNYADCDQAGTPKTITVKLDGVAPNSVAQVYKIDKEHGSSFDAWKRMGSPAFPSREQQKALKESAMLPPPDIKTITAESTIDLALDGHALALVIIPHNPAFQH